ncbi:MAG: competence/damage-inducible protein A [Myxococcota bacterium]
MRAEVICCGDELLSGTIADTNTQDFATILQEAGVEIVRSTAVGDAEDEIVEVLRDVTGRADLVIFSGGLGPTEDDRTAAAMARAAGVPLVRDDEALRRLETRMRNANVEVTENNRKQALVPAGCVVMQSEVGTAPGFHMQIGGAHVYVVPGVPREARWFLREFVLPELLRRSESAFITSTLRCVGITESKLDLQVQGLAERHPGVSVHFRTSFPENHLRLVARDTKPSGALHRLHAAKEDALQRLQQWVYSTDGRTISAVIRDELLARNQTLALAESCTGGLVQKLITDEPGSSKVFVGGVVAYANDVKVKLLGVHEEMLKAHGAVSPEVAMEMAEGVRLRLGSTWGMSITGVAGPNGGTPEKPVGLVYVGLSGPSGLLHKELRLKGDRERIRGFSAAQAMTWLLREMRG